MHILFLFLFFQRCILAISFSLPFVNHFRTDLLFISFSARSRLHTTFQKTSANSRKNSFLLLSCKQQTMVYASRKCGIEIEWKRREKEMDKTTKTTNAPYSTVAIVQESSKKSEKVNWMTNARWKKRNNNKIIEWQKVNAIQRIESNRIQTQIMVI